MTHPSWNAAQARDLYNMPQWGEGYFDVSAQGRVVVRPHPGRPDVTIDLFELARRLPREGLDLPVLVRKTQP